MEYVRRIITQDDAQNGNISNYLTDFGFVDQTGKGFSGRDLNSTREHSLATQIYWKNDTKRQSCVRGRNYGEAVTGSIIAFRPYRYFSSAKAWYAQNTYIDSWSSEGQCSFIGPTSLHASNDPNGAIIYTQLSLIPLINGGFIWNTIYKGDDSTPRTLTLVNENYPNSTTQRGGLTAITNCSLIGIPPHPNSLEVQPNYTYISWVDIGRRGSPGTYCYGGQAFLWDFLDQNITICIDDPWYYSLSSTKPNYENLLLDINHAQYTNLNKNVCVLIKMPRDNGYFENIYLMSTAPSNFRSGGIFSFAGRTFINVYSNVVLELPND